MKKFLAFVFAALLALLPVQAMADAYVHPSSWIPTDQARFSIDESSQWNKSSILWIVRDRKNSTMPDEYYCESVGSGFCDLDSGKYHLSGDSTIIAPRCETSSQRNCLEAVNFYDELGQKIEGTFIRHVDGPKLGADKKRNLTAGSTISLWSAPGLKHNGNTDTYAAQVGFGLEFDDATDKFKVTSVSAGVTPYREIEGERFKPVEFFMTKTKEGRSQLSGSANMECAWHDTGKCGRAEDFSIGTRAEVIFRVDKTVGGWFSGRMSNADIDIDSLNSATNRIRVTADPVQVARFSVVLKEKELSKPAKNLIQTFKWERPIFNAEGSNSGGGSGTRADYDMGFDVLNAFRTDAKDTSSGLSTMWNFQNSSAGQGSACLQDSSRVLGLVTTNSTVYQAAAPDFKGGFLNYRVGGMHYLSDGESLNLGKYDLVIRSDVARCLYGFSKAPLSATVAVVNDKGTKTTATTIVKETKNGWLKMAAYGFTFSKKTIKVKITKKK